MTRPIDCDEFLSDPAAHEEHVRSCSDCRDLVLELEKIDRAFLEGAIEAPALPALSATTLPFAPWEGARHRSWPLVFFVLSALLGAAVLLYASAGVAPSSGFRNVVTGDLLPIGTLIAALRHAGSGFQHAPTSFHVLIGVSFLLINGLFYLLLRRAPKGVDVTVR